jgi:hypothetical protein
MERTFHTPNSIKLFGNAVSDDMLIENNSNKIICIPTEQMFFIAIAFYQHRVPHRTKTRTFFTIDSGACGDIFVLNEGI